MWLGAIGACLNFSWALHTAPGAGMGVSAPVTPLGSDAAGMRESGVTLGCSDPTGRHVHME